MQETREERARFAAAIQKVALLCAKNEKPDRATLQLYWRALKDFSIGQIEAAAEELIRVETALVSVPPPGRWRQVCANLFELAPPTYKDPRAPIACEACGDTGWRPSEVFTPARAARGVVRCECKTGGYVPPVDLSLMMEPLRENPVGLGDELLPVEGESELQARRRVWGNQILTCACCQQPYRRRNGWQCCNPKGGMRSHVWADQWHIDCAGKGQHRCPDHCPHPDRPRQAPMFPHPAAGESIPAWAVRTGLREEDAPITPAAPAKENHEEPPPPDDAPWDGDIGF